MAAMTMANDGGLCFWSNPASAEIMERDRIPFRWFNWGDFKEVGRAKDTNTQSPVTPLGLSRGQ